MWDPAEVFWSRGVVLACSCVFLRPTRTTLDTTQELERQEPERKELLKGKNLKGKNLKGKNVWKARTWHKSKANPQGHVTFTTMPFATLLRRPAHFVCVWLLLFLFCCLRLFVLMFSSVWLSLCEIHSVANTSKNVSCYCQAVLLTVFIGHCIMLLGIDPHKNTKNVF